MHISKDFLAILSFLLLLATLILMRRSTRAMKIFFYIFSIFNMLILMSYKVADYFTDEGITEAVIFHIKYGLKGAGFMEYSSLILLSAFFVVSYLGLSYVLLFYNARKEAFFIKSRFLIPLGLFILSTICNPGLMDLYRMGFFNTHAYISYNNNNAKSGEFNKYYKLPTIDLPNKNMYNVIYIYAESLERTYLSDSLFPGLLENIKKLENTSSYSFENINQTIGTGWTIAGIVASQCGIPLISPSGSLGSNTMGNMDKFLPKATCIGDILKKYGYKLEYFGGGDLSFAGTGKFFKTHGFDLVIGEQYIKRNYHIKKSSAWGIYDDDLLDLAYKQIRALHNTGQPFAIFIPTLDTHHPRGHRTPSCANIKYSDGKNPILNSIKCADVLIYKFISKLINSNIYDNTLIILGSDHLAMRNTAYNILKKAKRRNLLTIFDPRSPNHKTVYTMGTTLDIGATILNLLDLGDALGLGRTLLNKQYVKERKYILSKLSYWRYDLESFWDFPKLHRILNVDPIKSVLNINGRMIRIPAILELGHNKELRVHFDADGQDFLNLISKDLLKNKSTFLRIDECRKFLPTYSRCYCAEFVNNNIITWARPIYKVDNISIEKLYGYRYAEKNNIILPQFLKLNFDHLYKFGKYGDGKCLLEHGWSHNETWGVWSDGYAASFVFRVPPPYSEDLLVTMNIHPYVNANHQKLNASIIINGKLIKKYQFKHSEKNDKIVFMVSRLNLLHNNGMVRVVIHIDNPISPKQAENNQSEDMRLLGIGLKSLFVKKKSH